MGLLNMYVFLGSNSIWGNVYQENKFQYIYKRSIPIQRYELFNTSLRQNEALSFTTEDTMSKNGGSVLTLDAPGIWGIPVTKKTY